MAIVVLVAIIIGITTVMMWCLYKHKKRYAVAACVCNFAVKILMY